MCRRSRPCSSCSRPLLARTGHPRHCNKFGSYIRSRGRVSARGNKDRTLYSSHHAVKKPPRATRQWQLRLPPLVRRIALLTKVFGVLHHFHDVNGGRGTHSRASSCRTGTYRHHAGHVTVAVITAVARMMKIWRIFLSSQRRWCSQASGSRRHRLFWGSVRAIRLSIATSYSSLPKIFLRAVRRAQSSDVTHDALAGAGGSGAAPTG